MENSTRINNSLKNTYYGTITQIVTVLISFITRTYFIKYLSLDYLGINGLFTNILTVLSMAELGFDGAMVYSMYQPLARDDKKKLKQLVNFYTHIYKVIGLTVGVLGLCLIPFLDIIIKNKPNVGNLVLIYLLFLFNSVFSYFFAYKRSILQADQKQFVISKIRLILNIIKSLIQIIILILFSNYLLFLMIQIVFTVIENMVISMKVDKIYPYLIDIKNEKLDIEEKKGIWNNVKALMIYKVGSTFLDGTDNLIISSFVGVKYVGYLSNYTLIVGSISMVIQQVTNAITGSIGNFIALEKESKQEELLNKLTFLYYIIFGSSFISLFMLLNPFISLWLGSDYLLPWTTVFVISLNWYIVGVLNPIWTFRSTKGLFVYGKYRPLVTALINIVVSIFLSLKWGVLGVLVGTTISRLLTNFWYDPYIVYKYGFKKSSISYLLKQTLYIIIIIIQIVILKSLFAYNTFSSIIGFLIQILLVILVVSLTNCLIFRKTTEFIFFKNLVLRILIKN